MALAQVGLILAESNTREKKYDLAMQQVRRSLDVYRSQLGERAKQTLKSMLVIANLHWRTGQVDAAEETLREVAAIETEKSGPGHPTTLSVQISIARLLLARGKPEDAEALCVASLEAHPDVLKPGSDLHGKFIGLLARIRYLAGDEDVAKELLFETLAGRPAAE